MSYLDDALEAALDASVYSDLDPEYVKPMIEAAEEAIRKDERSKLEARLLSDEVAEAFAEEIFRTYGGRTDPVQDWPGDAGSTVDFWRGRAREFLDFLRAALASQEKTEEAENRNERLARRAPR